jgi:hypothetical protein
METLADAYLRAVAYVRDTPKGYGAGLLVLERTLAEWHTVLSRANVQKLFAAFDDGLAEARARYAAAPADSRDADRAIGLALNAISEVNRQWHQSDAATPHPPGSQPGPYDPERDRAIATWAADAIARASYPRVIVPPLAPELTPEVCATWLEVFARGLATATARTVAMPAAILGGVLDFCSQGIVPSATRSPITSTRVAQRLGAELARDKTFKTFTLGDMEHWRLTRPRAQLAFDLPFEEGASPRKTRPGVAAGARAVLTGPMLRAYMATWALMSTWTHEHGGNNPFGIFELDLRRVLGELYGLRSVPTKAANGKSTAARLVAQNGRSRRSSPGSSSASSKALGRSRSASPKRWWCATGTKTGGRCTGTLPWRCTCSVNDTSRSRGRCSGWMRAIPEWQWDWRGCSIATPPPSSAGLVTGAARWRSSPAASPSPSRMRHVATAPPASMPSSPSNSSA